MKISIVIPALNEEKTVAICVKKGIQFIKNLNLDGEVLVSDNGSTDKTIEVASRAGARIVRVSRKGYGSAYMAGFKEAKGELIIMGDADDSYNFEEIAPFINKLNEGYDFVMGNRFKGRIQAGAMPFLHRYLGTPILTAVLNLFFRTDIGDTNCGMRGLTKDAFSKMRLKATGMEFATEMVVKASLVGLKIAEVPCNLYRDKRGRKPHLKSWSDGWRHLRFMLLFSPKWTFVIPGFILFTLGLIGMSFLSVRDLFWPGLITYVTQRHMLLLMLMVLLGSQIISLGLAAAAFSFSKHFDYASRLVKFLLRSFTLEKGVVCGLLIIGSSLLVFSYLFVSFFWRGSLPYLNDLLRLDLTIWAISGLVLGIQCIYSSFLVSLFYLKVK